jgi:hypothetical protein
VIGTDCICSCKSIISNGRIVDEMDDGPKKKIQKLKWTCLINVLSICRFYVNLPQTLLTLSYFCYPV